MRENRESFYDLFLCSRRSRCSRFMFLKRSVRWNFHRETRENREQKRECTWENMMGFFPSHGTLPFLLFYSPSFA